jgi:hypothetical protein
MNDTQLVKMLGPSKRRDPRAIAADVGVGDATRSPVERVRT